MPRTIRTVSLDLVTAHSGDLLRYIAEDVAALQYRIETGKYPAGIEYDISPSILIGAYANELERRGY